MSRERTRKGSLGRSGLPISKGYLRPPSRGLLLAVGLVLGVVLAGVALLDARYGSSGLLSGGPLSSAHAVLQSDCASCHGGFEAVTNEACGTCHEKLGDDLGLYTFAAHYVYRSGDFQRITTAENEMTCAECHPEHQGRDAPITRVADTQCLTCHEGNTFHKGHPAFFTQEDPRGDDDSIAFAHGHHTREVMEQLGLADVERACLACHQPDEAGRGFRTIDFDLHCDACHLETGTATARLPLEEAGQVGVASLADLRSGDSPGTRWSLFMNPEEFRGAGNLVMKTTLHHQDPWVLENLRRLRQRLFPNAGLADLLVASADVDPKDLRRLYEEAITTLETQIVGLRGDPNPDVQEQLETMQALLAEIRRALEDPTTPLDETEFLLAFDQPADLGDEEKASIDELVDGLTGQCQVCHLVENATFVRAEADQKSLLRAEFDHRAHVIQQRCLDCHNEIPVLDAIEGTELDFEVDEAAIFNLPPIQSCQECHRPQLAASSCTTCHLFHPDKQRRASLLLYDDGPAEETAPPPPPVGP